MADEKDRWGEKLRDVEAAREDQWARKRDRELLDAMRRKQASSLPCPHCKQPLVAREEGRLVLMECPEGQGVWLDVEVASVILRRPR